MNIFDMLRSKDGGTKDGGTPSERRSPLERELIHRCQEAFAGNETEQPLHYRLLFTGQVQGVGFRWTCQGSAEKLGLAGWVKNLRDGSVSMDVQGTPAQLIKHLDAMHQTYDRMGCRMWLEEAHELPASPEAHGFQVRY